MITLYRFDEIEKGLEERLSPVIKAKGERKYQYAVKYFKYVTELYEGGSIGYAIYPNRILTGMSHGITEKHPELDQIADLAASLDVPNNVMDKSMDRDRDTKKLVDLIKNLN